MAGEDEMTDILTEAYADNIKRSFAGLSLNGCALMIDEYGTDGANMADTWTVFGDPSLMVRTSNPDTLTVSHPFYVALGDSSITVFCTMNGARATLMLQDAILATGLVAGDSVNLTFPALMNTTDTLLLTVSNYNSIPYQSYIYVLAPVMAEFSGTPTYVTTGNPVTFTDLSTGNPTSWKWSFPGGTPDNSTLRNPVVTYTTRGTFDVQLIVSNAISCDTLLKTNYISADFPAQVAEPATDLYFSVSPNPNNGIFRITGSSFRGDKVSFRLINTVGTVIFEQNDIEVRDRLDISVTLPDLREGVYFLSLKGTTTARTKKVVIRK
jgi:PKD repeat protein